MIQENLRKSLWIMRTQNNEIIETNNWTRLLLFDDKINFYFLNMFLYMTSVVYCRTFLHFMSSLYVVIIQKNKFWKRIHPQSGSFEHRICAQTRDLQIFKMFNISQMNPKEAFHNTAYSSTTLHSRLLPLRTSSYSTVFWFSL